MFSVLVSRVQSQLADLHVLGILTLNVVLLLEELLSKIQEITVSERTWRKGTPRAPLVGLGTGAATAENGVEVPQKVETRSAVGSSCSASGCLPRERESTNSRGTRTPPRPRQQVHSSQGVEASKASID